MKKEFNIGMTISAIGYGITTAFMYAGMFFLVKWLGGYNVEKAGMVTAGATIGFTALSLGAISLFSKFLGFYSSEITETEFYKEIDHTLAPYYKLFALGMIPGLLLVGIIWGTQIGLIVGSIAVGAYSLGFFAKRLRLI